MIWTHQDYHSTERERETIEGERRWRKRETEKKYQHSVIPVTNRDAQHSQVTIAGRKWKRETEGEKKERTEKRGRKKEPKRKEERKGEEERERMHQVLLLPLNTRCHSSR